MGYEYDPDKSAENKRKHGIDFEAAQRHWSAAVTRRGDSA